MFNRWGSRIKLLSLTTVAATALVVAWWPEAAKADGEETYQVLINAQASNLLNDECYAHALVYNGTPYYDFVWTSTYLWNGSRFNGTLPEIRAAVLTQPGTHTQTLEVWDDADHYDNDVRDDIYVGSDGDVCTFSP